MAMRQCPKSKTIVNTGCNTSHMAMKRALALMLGAMLALVSLAQGNVLLDRDIASGDTIILGDSTTLLTGTTLKSPQASDLAVKFNPNPMRAMWLSALCPGAGQIYNRRYWKLPIVIGAFVGLTYGTSWNNRMLNDYSKAYRDITDNDPNTRSYMDFYPPTVQESDLDKTWLTSTLKSRKDYYRRYRDICIIGIAAVYLLNVVDAYVDASMMHFDVSPDLSMDWGPAVIDNQHSRLPSIGLGCHVNF